MSRPMFDSEYLYGLHDPGGEQLMLDANAPGWVVISEEIDANPNDNGGSNYTHLSGRGLGVIVRLNYGYYGKGTITVSYTHLTLPTRDLVLISVGAVALQTKTTETVS